MNSMIICLYRLYHIHQIHQEGKHGVFGRISHYRAWIESHMNHSSNHFCDGGLDARDIQPKCQCGGADGVEVSIQIHTLTQH